MKTLNGQKGLSGIGWLFVLALIAGGVLVTLKLLPAYLENMSVVTVLKGVRESGDVYRTSGEVRSAIVRRFGVNEVEQVGKDDILISRNGGIYEVIVEYEVQVPFVYNIDFLLTFNNRAEVPAG